MSQQLLTFERLKTSSEGKTLLMGCSGAVFAGDFIVITGRSGGGKSVLLRTLAGLQTLDSGKLSFKNEELEKLGMAKWRHAVSYIGQQALMTGDTVEETLKRPFEFAFHQGRQWDKNFAQQHLIKLGKSDNFLKSDTQYLSGGERQLVSLLRSLQLDPYTILLDEPTAALDKESRDEVQQLVKNWLSENPEQRAVIWVTHDESQLTLGNRHWVVNGGELTEENHG